MRFVYVYAVENGVNERMERIVIDGCMLCDQTPHNDVIGNMKKYIKNNIYIYIFFFSFSYYHIYNYGDKDDLTKARDGLHMFAPASPWEEMNREENQRGVNEMTQWMTCHHRMMGRKTLVS